MKLPFRSKVTDNLLEVQAPGYPLRTIKEQRSSPLAILWHKYGLFGFLCEIGLKLDSGTGIISILADPGKYGTGKQVVRMNFLPQLLEKFPGDETYLG